MSPMMVPSMSLSFQITITEELLTVVMTSLIGHMERYYKY